MHPSYVHPSRIVQHIVHAKAHRWNAEVGLQGPFWVEVVLGIKARTRCDAKA